jgi:hypothetical protein
MHREKANLRRARLTMSPDRCASYLETAGASLDRALLLSESMVASLTFSFG